MAQDADGNYYYEEGTIAEQLDSWDVYEDSDGNLGFYDGTDEKRFHGGADVLSGPRDDPADTEIASGEGMLYITDGTTTGAEGDLCYAYNDGSSVTAVIVGDLA